MPKPSKEMLLTAFQFATVFLGAAGGFFKRIAPPDDTVKFFPGLAAVLIAAAYVLALRRMTRRVQTALFLVLLFVGTSLLVGYFWEYQTRTETYQGQLQVCGTNLTEVARKYVESNQPPTREALLRDFGGNTKAIWTINSIVASRLILGVVYSSALGLLALGLLLGLQSNKPQQACEHRDETAFLQSLRGLGLDEESPQFRQVVNLFHSLRRGKL